MRVDSKCHGVHRKRSKTRDQASGVEYSYSSFPIQHLGTVNKASILSRKVRLISVFDDVKRNNRRPTATARYSTCNQTYNDASVDQNLVLVHFSSQKLVCETVDSIRRDLSVSHCQSAFVEAQTASFLVDDLGALYRTFEVRSSH